MKKRVQLIIALLLLTILTASAQDSPYQKAMKKEIAKLIESDSLPVLQQSANAFGRIAELNPNEWLPAYYQALAYTFQGLDKSLSLDKKDELLAKADELAQKADALSKNNTEIVALQGFVLMAKLNADAASRGQHLSGQVLQTLGKARAMDPKNPRAFALTAQMEYGMAQFFGSGTEKACGYAKESVAIFASQDEESLKTAMLPTWGKSLAEKMAKSCP
ncbi:hypothetical protein LXM25_09665 [Dyadobacter sp. LJ53]|uniref:hypothetical protein n=1 Tax=Dyadobacter chenwenxiniae TaxID=2906456 RepID=UPI001F1EF5A9|nr:hypothetical protein [Dyadobacter chenwenxiniae]MCF0050324.1 hypothetical protein [Dyadobacter chenwenxiniae]